MPKDCGEVKTLKQYTAEIKALLNAGTTPDQVSEWFDTDQLAEFLTAYSAYVAQWLATRDMRKTS